MGLQLKYFDYMKNGTKRIELRLFDEKRQRVRLGDIIEFARGHTDLTFYVTEIGCGIAGYTPGDVVPLFAGVPENVVLPEAFCD